MKHAIICLLSALLLTACGNEAATDAVIKPEENKQDEVSDTMMLMVPVLKEQFITGYNGFDEDEKKEKSKLLKMSIDSTYAAINELQLIKETINTEASSGLTVAQRNAKTRSLLELGNIENILCRQIDAVLLQNLQSHTKTLADINIEVIAKDERLARISEQLFKAGRIIDKLSGILSLCITKGVIKPATPIVTR